MIGKITADNNKMAQVYPVVSGVVKTITVIAKNDMLIYDALND